MNSRFGMGRLSDNPVLACCRSTAHESPLIQRASKSEFHFTLAA